MKIIIFTVFIINCQIIYGQMLDVETKLYDLFAPVGCSYISSRYDSRYHPAVDTLSGVRSINMHMSYHDIYREQASGNGGSKKNSMYNTGLESEFPLKVFQNNFKLNLQFRRNTFSSFYNSKNNEAVFTGTDWNTYTAAAGLLFDDDANKFGITLKYSAGNYDADLKINDYSGTGTNLLADRYFYDLLEPAFGNDIRFKIRANGFNYALEYIREVSRYINLGIYLYQEINNYKSDIKYYGSVETLEGEKVLTDLFEYNRYVFGLTLEYKIGDFVFRSAPAYSIPDYRLNINQDRLMSKNNVCLEISNLSKGYINGAGTTVGLGVLYKMGKSIFADISYSWIRNHYTAELAAGTPVLGFEILPIAHQLRSSFNDKMINNLFSLGFNHNIGNRWGYSVNIEYLNSYNKVDLFYKILTEFGFDNSSELQKTDWNIEIYKIDLQTHLFITENIGIKILFAQYIPVLKSKDSNPGINEAPAGREAGNSKGQSRGGSTYSVSLIYNFK